MSTWGQGFCEEQHWSSAPPGQRTAETSEKKRFAKTRKRNRCQFNFISMRRLGTRLRTCSAVIYRLRCDHYEYHTMHERYRCEGAGRQVLVHMYMSQKSGKRNRLTSVREATAASMTRRRFSALRTSSKYLSPYAFQLSPSALVTSSPYLLS